MELIQRIEGFTPKNDPRLLGKAEQLRPVLHYRVAGPMEAFVREETGDRPVSLEELPRRPLGPGDRICLDFGTHMVGRITLSLGSSGSHPDAPALFQVRLAEIRRELEEDPKAYHGWVSRSWIQEETLRVDELPARVDLPRRCAFRFLELEVLDTSPKYRLLLQEVRCVTESSADLSQVTPLSIGDGLLERIDRAGLRTLADCTQEIFEDGPKRDQRLWMGDLRLQALASYASFRSLDLVRRCLYLFAGTRFPDGRISACVFTKPAPEADDTWLLDYSLFFPVALEEYLEERDDPETLEDLYPAAMEQIDLIRARFTDGILPRPEDGEATFVDWCDGLDKRACAQAILLYAARHGRNLARRMGDREREADLTVLTERLEHGARETFWDPEQGFFVSGGQISIASQVWMILAGVLKPEEARDVMERSDAILENFPMQTPYMHHYYVSALLQAGLAEKALAVIRDYWGGMLEAGADTFWEAWDPAHPDGSPYGGLIVNSFCHAWSCTPVYLLRRCFSGSPQAKEAPQES